MGINSILQWSNILRTFIERASLNYKVKGDSKIKVYPVKIDPLYINYLIEGLSGNSKGWTVNKFVDGMNRIVAEHFNGKEITLMEWKDASQNLMKCFTVEEYAKNNYKVNLDILRNSMNQS